MTSIMVFLVAMFLVYNYLIFELVDAFLEKPRLKKIFRIPVGIVNTLIAALITMIGGYTLFETYIALSILLFLEYVIFYKDNYMSSLFCMLACIVHIMAIRAICVSVFALVMQSTLYTITHTPLLFGLSSGITLLILNITTVIVTKFVPAKGIRIINQHIEQLRFMIAWLAVFGIYLLINSNVYNTPDTHFDLLVNQIIAPVAILIGTYLILFFSIKTGELLGYREKNQELQNTVDKERQYRTTIDKGVFKIIEINFDRGEILSGFEDYEELLGDSIHDYGKMFEFITQTTVHAEDRKEFMKYLSPLTVVQEFEAGTTEIAFDYRRLMPDDHYIWMHVLMALVRDTQSEDIKGFMQIKDIDVEKRLQIELQYKAERDLLTGLYNKSTTELLISSQLTAVTGNLTSSVLFIIDIDNFKTINDRLGHLYGDAVLSELSESLRRIFKEGDIVGRIGGDEFLVFAEGFQNESAIVKKANSICTAFLQTYANEKNEDYTVSSSVGIAVFPKDGDRYETLFKCADAALYVSKAQGKNRYSFYDKNIAMPYVSSRTEIDTQGLVQKSFKDNRIEYVFRLLYGSEYTKAAIESALELIAKNFGFSRANIFEFNELSTHFSGVFEWCAVGIDSVSDHYIDMPVKSFEFIVSSLEKYGGMFIAVPSDFPESAQESYTSIGIKSIVHFSIIERDNLIGVIAFQHCVSDNFQISDSEFEELRTICQVLSVFMAKQLSNEREMRHHQAIEAVMDNTNSIAYVIDRETYEVFYENQNTSDITGHPSVGTKCFYSYRGLDAPCEDCPLIYLSEENPRCTLELFTSKFKIYTKTSAALINWSNDREAMLISSVDITEYK